MSSQAFPAGERPHRPRLRLVHLAIAVTTLLALALRILQLTRPGSMAGIVEYDDGPYVGSAILLTHGILPYRDFIFVQPPGITLLLAPVALLARLGLSTPTVMDIGRVLTALVSSAGVLLTGLLVRHRGTLAVAIAGGILAIYPGSIQAAHTVLVEPWLVLLCLLGALVIFDGDRLSENKRRLLWGGVLFGLAGAVEGWAIVAVTVIALLYLPRVRMLGRFVKGVAAGFLIPVLPFVLASPRGFYQGVITAQIGPRANAISVSVLYRFKLLTGLTWLHPLSNWVTMAGALLVVALIVAPLGFACLLTARGPWPLEWFVLLVTAATVVMFLEPSQFIYHFAGWLGPFLALSIALSLTGLAEAAQEILPLSPHPWPQAALTTVALPVIVWLAALQVAALGTSAPAPVVAQTMDKIIPPGACVLSDTSPPLIMLDRLVPTNPRCVILLDSTGADLELSHGLKPDTGAWQSEPTEEMWWRAFRNAQYFLLRGNKAQRVPWTHKLRAWFQVNYTLVYRQPLSSSDRYRLYRRDVQQFIKINLGPPAHADPRPAASAPRHRHLSFSAFVRASALTLAPSAVYLAAGLLLVAVATWWRRRRQSQGYQPSLAHAPAISRPQRHRGRHAATSWKSPPTSGFLRR
jgi:hypothetical protein